MQIRITKNTVTPEIQRLLGAVKRPKAMMQAGAKSVQVEISAHLRRLQARGNVKGWPSQKFFAGKPSSVEKNVGISRITDKGFEVVIADPRFAHRIAGGPVTAKRAKNLAIPLAAEAYAAAGKGSIKESMPGLKVIIFKRGVYLCREVAETARGRGGMKRLRLFPMFKLVKRVTHKPHPEELPDVKKLGTVAQAAMLKAGNLLFNGQK